MQWKECAGPQSSFHAGQPVLWRISKHHPQRGEYKIGKDQISSVRTRPDSRHEAYEAERQGQRRETICKKGSFADLDVVKGAQVIAEDNPINDDDNSDGQRQSSPCSAGASPCSNQRKNGEERRCEQTTGEKDKPNPKTRRVHVLANVRIVDVNRHYRDRSGPNAITYQMGILRQLLWQLGTLNPNSTCRKCRFGYALSSGSKA
jgi:hypothetical protein